MRLSVVGYGRCESEGQELQLDSVSDLSVKWTTDNDKLLKIEKSGRENGECIRGERNEERVDIKMK